ncbi:MAG: hypothetical protein LBU40_04345 [Methanobrevibacter sp.]|jgi:hypothetical protein|nr:hypothetical protein [Methanobrevibacter sp.]
MIHVNINGEERLKIWDLVDDILDDYPNINGLNNVFKSIVAVVGFKNFKDLIKI